MITSTQNNRVKGWMKLHTKKERTKTKTFLVEGFHLIEEAWKSDWKIVEVIIQKGIEYPSWVDNLQTTFVNDIVFQHIAQTKSPQGIAAVIEMNESEVSVEDSEALLFVDAVQDPGNLGTIIRTADAAGFAAVYVGEGSVDIYNDKVVRATQGSLFHIPVKNVQLQDEITNVKKMDYEVWAAALEGATNYTEVSMPTKVALLLGNEGAGIQVNLLKQADRLIKIPIYGKAESLNVSVASGILMYAIKEKLAK